jgi:hemin uptake protein HemP
MEKPPATPDPPRRITATELFAGRDRVIIRHAETEYELRITRRKRMILTKREPADGAGARDGDGG